MTDLNTRLCERLATMTRCPLCGWNRKSFESYDRMAVALFTCGADIVAIGGTFTVALGCRTRLDDALALIKAEEEARVETADAR